jgi:iron complex transport system substrate-binding protein
MNIKSLPLFILAALIVISLYACGMAETQQPYTVTDAASVAANGAMRALRTVVDQAGRTVAIDAPAQRIVSGYYISSSACIALGLADRLVGIEAKAASRPIYGLAKPQLLSLPDVGTSKEFNLEACIALEPDLVILPYRLRESADIMEELGVNAIVVDPESYEKLIEMVALIGEAAGAQERAQRLAAWIEGEREAIEDAREAMEDARDAIEEKAGQPAPKPLVYIGGVSSYLTTASDNMFQAALIELAGGRNAASGIEGSGASGSGATGSGRAGVSSEQLLAMDPEAIVIPSEAAYGIDDITSDPMLESLAAVRGGKVFKMPGDFEAWDSPLPSCMLGAGWLLSVLHEGAYPMAALREDAAAFYREFYGIEIDAGLIEWQ